MAHPNPIRRLLDAGLQVSELTQANAERIVKEMVKAGEVRRKDGEKVVRELLENSREATEKFQASVRDEVARQFGALAARLDQVESLMEQLVSRVAPGSSGPTAPAPAPRKAAASKRAPAETSQAKKSQAKKAPAKKARAKKSPARRARAKKAASVSSGVAPVTATKRPVGADVDAAD